ncbi:hypothetical protein ABTD98_14000 [Acinetobacter baumannii]
MSLEDLQLEQGTEPNAELSTLDELNDDELLAALDAAGTPFVEQQPEPEPTAQTEDEVQEPEPTEPAADDQPVEGNDPQEPVEPEDEEVTTPATDPVEPKEEVQQPAPKPEAAQPDDIDYKAFYETVTKQFKANGREIQVKNAEDIIALMQQGANYGKKMAAIKPAMQVHRTLEKHGLMDPATIGFMIDLYQGKPEAIAKLAAERKIDLFNLDADSAEGYAPQSPLVSEREVEISTVMQELSEFPSFQQTFETLGTWDEASQKQIIESPRMLHYFQEHKELGIFDNIMNTIATERMFGRLQGVSDLDAYRLVGDHLYGQKEQPVQQPVVQPTPVPVPVPAATPVVAPKPDAAINQKRSAAAAPRKVANQPAVESFNPLAISDEELMAIADRNLRLQ